MNNKDRQLTLDTKMYRNKSYGKEPYCGHCWAKCKGCIAGSAYRSTQLQCVKAECRMKGIPFNLREIIYPISYSGYHYGLTLEERNND